MSRDMLAHMADLRPAARPERIRCATRSTTWWLAGGPSGRTWTSRRMQVLSRLSRLARHLDRARRAAFAAHDLEPWEFDVLSALRRQGPPYQLSPGALLHATLVTSGTMTNRIDRLAAAGLVSRHRDPQDKRGVLVALTERGKQAADAALAGLLDRERELLAGLAAGQQDELAGAAAGPARAVRRAVRRRAWTDGLAWTPARSGRRIG